MVSRVTTFNDIEFTPDGERVIIPTDSIDNNGIVLSIDTRRWYLQNDNWNDSTVNTAGTYLTVLNSLAGIQANANINPIGVDILPQRMAATPDDPWRAVIANKGPDSDEEEDSVLLQMPSLTHEDIIETSDPGHPVCRGAEDVAVNTLGTRAFFGFTYSNNIGLSENPSVAGANEIISATQTQCPPTCLGPGMIHEIAYTPFLDKVIATIYWNTLAESKVMVLDANSVSLGYTGAIPDACYQFVQDSSIKGPEGIGLFPFFDRDGDKISDLIEARNQGTNTVNFSPTIPDTDTSRAVGTPANGSLTNGILLPEEGIGYRHFYGTDAKDTDNWGTLKLVQVIEQVGREWCPASVGSGE